MAGTSVKKQFAGKVAVVTGGTQGLGEAIATLFAERGVAGLVIVGRNARKGKDVAAGFTKSCLAIHHARASEIAQVLDHLCGDICHLRVP